MDRRTFLKIAGSGGGATSVTTCFQRADLSGVVPFFRNPILCRFPGNEAAERGSL